MNSRLSHGFWEVFKITGGLITSVTKTSPEVCQRQKWRNLNIGVRSDSLKCGVPAHVIVFLKNIAGFLYLDLLKEPPKRSKSAIDSPNIGFPIGKHKKNHLQQIQVYKAVWLCKPRVLDSHILAESLRGQGPNPNATNDTPGAGKSYETFPRMSRCDA